MTLEKKQIHATIEFEEKMHKLEKRNAPTFSAMNVKHLEEKNANAADWESRLTVLSAKLNIVTKYGHSEKQLSTACSMDTRERSLQNITMTISCKYVSGFPNIRRSQHP